MKVLFQYCRNNLSIIAINVICIIACAFFNQYDIVGRNAILNIAPAFPFMSLGYYLHHYNTLISAPYGYLKMTCLAIAMIVVVMLVLFLNDVPWMWKNGYGQDYMMCLIGGMAGTILIYTISKALEKYTSNTLVLLSNGTLVILALHPMIVRLVLGMHIDFGLLMYPIAIIILLLFVPILLVFKKWMPILAR